MLKYRKRRRIRRREVKRLAEEIMERWGDCPFSGENQVEIAEMGEIELIFSDGIIVGAIYDRKAFLTLRGILACKPNKRCATVDMGAVRFIYNGADVMAPGIVDADAGISEGDPVWVKEEVHGRPIAVGIALTDGNIMKKSKKGKAIKTIHYVGDKIWKFNE